MKFEIVPSTKPPSETGPVLKVSLKLDHGSLLLQVDVPDGAPSTLVSLEPTGRLLRWRRTVSSVLGIQLDAHGRIQLEGE